MKPYFAHDGITIYHGDFREWLAPDVRFSAIVTDPPYGETSLMWDSWVDGWPELLREVAPQMWCFGSLRMFLKHFEDFKTWRFAQEIVWEKHNGSGFHADRFRRVHEFATHWYRGEWQSLTKNVQTTPDATARTVRRRERPAHMGEIENSTYTSVHGGPRMMRSVIYAPSEHGKAFHPTQKPVAILLPLIEYSTNRGDVVFDPFMGSGSTLVAAKLCGRGAVGIEASEKYCEAAAKRLEQGIFDLATPAATA